MDLSNPLLWLVLVLAVILGLVISRPRPASLTPPRRPEPPAMPAPPGPHAPVPFQIGVLNVKPGDVLIVRCQSSMPYDAMESMLRQLSTAFPPGTKAVVLGTGVDLSVMRPAPQEEKPHG